MHLPLMYSLHGGRANFLRDCGLQDSLLSNCFYHFFLSVVQRQEGTLVSVVHACSHRGGNYNCQLSKTVLLLSIASILLVLSQHRNDSCDS